MAAYLRTNAELLARLPTLAAATRVAMDTEFHPERSYVPKLMLLQLCAEGGEPWVVDPLGVTELRALGEALKGVELVVHGGAIDLQLFERHLGLRPERVFDTQVAAGFAGLGYPRRLQDLEREVLGGTLSKGETLSDWSRRPLSEAQLQYAADDVGGLIALADAIAAAVAARGNTQWMLEAQVEARNAALAGVDEQDAWRRVAGAHVLDELGRAALCGLAAWREVTARELDQPVGHVASDSVLLDLARRRPHSVGEMKENRRMPTQVWRQYGERLLQLLASPPPAPPPLLRSVRADVVRLAGRIHGESLGIAPELLLRECDVNYILAGSHLVGWRGDAIEILMQKIMAKRLFIGFDGFV